MAQKRNLPKPSKGRRLSKKAKIKIATAVCELYQEGKYTIASCLAECGVASESTWALWIKEIAEIDALYKEAQDKRDEIQKEKKESLLVEIKNAALLNLHKMVTGYQIEVMEQTVEPGGQDEEGTEIPTRILQTKIKQIHIQPHAGLIKYALNNLDGHYFTNNPEPYQKGNEKYPDEIQVTIKGQDVPPVTDESDIDDITR